MGRGALGRLLDWPRVHDRGELHRLAGVSALTLGLEDHGGADAPAAYSGEGATIDAIRALERPGIAGPGGDWRLLSGEEVRPPGPPGEPGMADAWLELLYWWRWVPSVCAQPRSPRAADICAKLLAESAAVRWALLERERPPGSERALVSAAGVRGAEESAELYEALSEFGVRAGASVERALPAALAIAADVAAAIASRLRPLGRTKVALEGISRGRPLGEGLPLADWRAVVCPPAPFESFRVLDGSPADPAKLARLGSWSGEPQPALAGGALIVMPSRVLIRSRMRAIKAPFSDPVSFAMLAGDREAFFPDAPGWSARDWATRAVAEHAALLAAGAGEGSDEAAALITAARAGLFLQSLEEGTPALAVSPHALLDALGRLPGGSAAEELAAAVRDGKEPDPAALSALRGLVSSLPAYRRGT